MIGHDKEKKDKKIIKENLLKIGKKIFKIVIFAGTVIKIILIGKDISEYIHWNKKDAMCNGQAAEAADHFNTANRTLACEDASVREAAEKMVSAIMEIMAEINVKGKEEPQLTGRTGSASQLGAIYGFSGQKMNHMLKVHGFLDGEPGNYFLTEKGKRYANEHFDGRGNGESGRYNHFRSWYVWDESVLPAMGLESPAAIEAKKVSQTHLSQTHRE